MKSGIETPWTLADALVAGAFLLAFAAAGALAIVHPPAEIPFPGLRPILPQLLLTPLFALALLLVRKLRSGAPFTALFGNAAPEAILRAMLIGVGAFVALSLLGEGVRYLSSRLGYNPPLQSLVSWLISPDTPAASKAVLCAYALLCPPLAEEILFRGVLLSAFAKRGRPVLGIAATSILFALCHGSLLALLPMALFGIALARLALRTGGILPGIACHLLFNAFNLAVALCCPPAAP